ncbi:MAG: tetratricopeptide repeat protein, partial [Myxococcota bacterium]
MPAPRRRHSAASSLRCVLGGLLLCVVLAGCGSDEGRLDEARDSVREALARQDIAGLQQALSKLRAVPAETPEEVLAVSSLMMRAGETAHAVWILEAALARHPERHDLRIRLARGVLVVGDLPRVRGVLEPVEPASEFHLAALLLRARVELDAGDLDAGLALLVEAETRYPDSPQASLARVSTLLQEDRVDEARAAVEQAIRSAGSEERGQQLAVLAAGIEITHGDADSGIARLHDLVAANPLDAELRGTLAQGLQLAGRIEEAVELIREGLLLDPGQPALFAILAQAELAAGRPSAAEEALLGMIVLADSPSARYLLARVRIFDGRKQDAAETLREAAERFPETPMLRMHEAEAWIDLGLLGRALEALDSFRRAAPGDPHVDYLGARMALANGDPHRAARDLLGVVSRLDRAYTQFTLGQALEAMGDLSGAERRFGLALLRDTRHPAPAAALIRLAESRGDWEMASNYALQLVTRAPGNPQAHATLVAAFTRARQPKRAEAAARFYAQRFPARADAAAL